MSDAPSSPGAVLRQVREQHGMSIEEVAQALKLAPRQVEAIESDAFDQLRGTTFARGFVRNYARFLGLDPAPLLLSIGSNIDPRQVELAPLSNARGEMPNAGSSMRSLLPAGLALVALVALALAGVQMGWFRAPAQPGAGDANASAQVAQADKATANAKAAATAPTSTAPTVATAAAPGGSVAAPPIAAPSPATGSEPAVPKPALPGTQRLSFAFDRDAWVEVRDATGKIVHAKLHPGGSHEDLDIGGKPPYALVVGNAAEVHLRYKDKPVDLTPYVKVSVARLRLQ